jgi:8-amino-7-oxononanoate synthase
MDLFEKCQNFTAAQEARREGYYPYFIPLEENEGTEVTYRGKRLVMIGSNNYLGLTTHPQVRQAALEALVRFGTSCTGSRFLNGNLAMHEQLEEELAAFVGKEAALVFSTGFHVNLGAISTLVGKDDMVLIDKDDHASIVDGCRLSFGKTRRFRHNDMEDLERHLKACPLGSGRLIVVDGIFSMGGDIAPLPDIVKLAKRYGARVMVDDAHSIGVLGEGKGTAEHFKITDQVDLIMGTFSKSLASLGGFVAGERQTVDYIKHFARSLIFSASIPPANVAAALAALEVIRTEPERRERLWAISKRVHRALQEMGFDTGHSETPIIPVIVGHDRKTFDFWRCLFDAGVFTNPVVSPAVAPQQSRLRTSFMATHTDKQMDKVLAAFKDCGKKMGIPSR